MRKCCLIFAFLILFSGTFEARADFEVIQETVSGAVEVPKAAESMIMKEKAMEENANQLKSRLKKAADKVKKAANSIKDGVANIKNKITGLVSAAKTGDLEGLAAGGEFAALNETFDGSKSDEEMGDNVLDSLVRKKGENSIGNAQVVSKAINQKNGRDIADMYGDAFTQRLELKQVKDEYENPESIDDAVSLYQQEKLDYMRRMNAIARLNNKLARVKHTRAIENVQGGAGNDNAEEE